MIVILTFRFYSSEQVIELLNSFLQFFVQMLLNCAQLVVLIVSRLYWSSVDCIDRQLIAARKGAPIGNKKLQHWGVTHGSTLRGYGPRL